MTASSAIAAGEGDAVRAQAGWHGRMGIQVRGKLTSTIKKKMEIQ